MDDHWASAGLIGFMCAVSGWSYRQGTFSSSLSWCNTFGVRRISHFVGLGVGDVTRDYDRIGYLAMLICCWLLDCWGFFFP